MQPGARIITPSMTACPPMYGLVSLMTSESRARAAPRHASRPEASPAVASRHARCAPHRDAKEAAPCGDARLSLYDPTCVRRRTQLSLVAYFLRKRSTRPAVSMSFCLPV
jgi:hypothetical protein